MAVLVIYSKIMKSECNNTKYSLVENMTILSVDRVGFLLFLVFISTKTFMKGWRREACLATRFKCLANPNSSIIYGLNLNLPIGEIGILATYDTGT